MPNINKVRVTSKIKREQAHAQHEQATAILSPFTHDCLQQGVDNNKIHVYVDFNSFVEKSKLPYTELSVYTESVGDILADTELSRKYGNWVFTEFGDGYHVFIKLGDYQAGGQPVSYLLNNEKGMVV